MVVNVGLQHDVGNSPNRTLGCAHQGSCGSWIHCGYTVLRFRLGWHRFAGLVCEAHLNTWELMVRVAYLRSVRH